MKSAPRRRSRLALEVAVVLVVKLVALALMWKVWFSDPAAHHLGPERVGSVVYSSASAPPPTGGKHARP
jgi:hypothetical protein